MNGFVNPPWCLIGQILSRVRAQLGDTGLKIPTLLSSPSGLSNTDISYIDYPKMILHNPVLISQPLFKPQLAVLHISGSDVLTNTFVMF